jgi:hypothetical protein
VIVPETVEFGLGASIWTDGDCRAVMKLAVFVFVLPAMSVAVRVSKWVPGESEAALSEYVYPTLGQLGLPG